MDRLGGAPSSSTPEPYSPQRRTALVLTGIGTAGAYHAGVLRALHEAGVKLDIVAGRGVGVIGALFAAVDGSQRLWDEKGFWRAEGVDRLYEVIVPLAHYYKYNNLSFSWTDIWGPYFRAEAAKVELCHAPLPGCLTMLGVFV